MTWTFKDDIEPQPARGKLKESMWTSSDYWAEEKLDGERRIVQMCSTLAGISCIGRFTGRFSKVQKKPIEKTEQLPHLSGRPSQLTGVVTTPIPASLAGTVLDGELVLPPGYECEPGGKSKAVTSMANSSAPIAIQKQMERGWLCYTVFDCLWFEGVDIRGMSLLKRREYASQAVMRWANPFVSLVDAEPVNKKSYFDAILKSGGEGIILKNKWSLYGEQNAWIKQKGVWCADTVVMGYQPAEQFSEKVDGTVSETSFYKEGLIGAIIVGQYTSPNGYGQLVEVARISGIDLALRKEMSVDGEKYMGQVIEIEHNGREPSGRFRHPRFNRFRYDKPANSCIIDMNEI